MLMSLNNITSSQLRKLIPIVERKERLREELAAIESKLSAHLSPEPTSRAKRKPPRTREPRAAHVSKSLEVRSPKPRSAQRRGGLKDAILAALQTAGREGLSAKDLSAALGVKNQSIHVWFSSTGRNIKGLTKLGKGRWTYNGN